VRGSDFMLKRPTNVLHVAPQFQPIMRIVGLDAETIFTHPKVVAWRKLPDRENCTLDGEIDGEKFRLHIKRYFAAPGFRTPAEEEVEALRALQIEQIPTLTLVGWGMLKDRRSFVITADLAGYQAADKLIEAGRPFESLLEPTADLAAKLHKSGLHHRDLYLCHFFARADGAQDVRLIDAARVARLGGIFSRGRWIVKDLAQFWYSTTQLKGTLANASEVSDEQRERWLARYAQQRGIEVTPRLRKAIARKVRAIGKHDANLKQSQPTRNVSIPQSSTASSQDGPR
jgi:hypothetical protein